MMTNYIDIQPASSNPADPNAWTTHLGTPPFEITGLTNGVQYRWRRGDELGLVTPRAAAIGTIWNSLDKHPDVALSDDNRAASAPNGAAIVRGMRFVSAGRWYFEIHLNGSDWRSSTHLGVATSSAALDLSTSDGSNAALLRADGDITHNQASRIGVNSGLRYEAIGRGAIRVAVDQDARRVYFARDDGAWVGGVPGSGTGAHVVPQGALAAFAGPRSTSGGSLMTLRSRAGDFAYSVPAGFKAYAEV